MPGVGLATHSRTVQMAGYPEGDPRSQNLWLTFNLEYPLELRAPVIGPDGKGHPAGFVMFTMTPDEARALSNAILKKLSDQDPYSHVRC